MQIFKNKTVIITGASAGVGEATARTFAEQQANLVLIARGKEALDKITQELSTKTNVLSVQMDVCDSEACRSMLKSAKEKFGAVHVLVNNAGYHQRGRLENNDPSEYSKMTDVNLRAPIELSALVLPYMKEAGEGAIVNVASLAGRAPLNGAATYAANKAGLLAFTHSLHDEMRGTGIHVGAVSPGPIMTDFILGEGKIDEVEDIVFSQPMSTPEQVAEAILNVAQGKAEEIVLPRASGWLTTAAYLMPRVRRWVRPLLYAKGKKVKAKYKSNM